MINSELFSEHRTPGGAVMNVVTEAPVLKFCQEAGRGLPNPGRMSQYDKELNIWTVYAVVCNHKMSMLESLKYA